MLDGHIIDSGTLSKVLDLILLHGGDYEITSFQIGTTREAASHAEIVVRAGTAGGAAADPAGARAAWRQPRGARRGVGRRRRPTASSRQTSTRRPILKATCATNGQWLPIEQIEMDCGVTLVERADGPHAVTVPVHRIRRDDQRAGPRGRGQSRRRSAQGPRVGLRLHVERGLRRAAEGAQRSGGGRGHDRDPPRGQEGALRRRPAIIHTGAGKYLEALIGGGWIDVLFAGNALATHDIEAALLGTSLGVKLSTGVPMATGHNHHLRAINAIRAVGSIRAAVLDGVLTRAGDARLRHARRGLRAGRQHPRRWAAARCHH